MSGAMLTPKSQQKLRSVHKTIR